jgi:ubiquinone/menaquinone biosynthesis C-methylase UbiE
MTQSAPYTAGRTLDHVAGVYDLLAPLMMLGQEKRLGQKVITLLDLGGGEKILDIGCGTGTLTIEIAKHLTQKDSLVVGLDAAPKMIAAAHKKSLAHNCPHIRFDVAVAEKLPYEAKCFDAVISTFFFHHINYDLKKQSLLEIRRVLKKGGRVIIVDVDTPTSLFGRLCAWSGYVLFRQNEIKENIKGKLRQAFIDTGFTWDAISHHSGYITIFKLTEGA